jgi:hypothetical protein
LALAQDVEKKKAKPKLRIIFDNGFMLGTAVFRPTFPVEY